LTDDALLEQADTIIRSLKSAKGAICDRVYGQEMVIDHVLSAVLAGGHAVLVGVPGLAKTRLVETVGTVLGLAECRVQFTPDLMPSDILGAEILDDNERGERHFRFIPGPVFCQLLMADEINRASPRTQSALLQAMQEQRVTIAGHTYPLPSPFHVIATQNPLEQEGTYPLPEAQLDRFLLEIPVTYPDLEAERKILLATTGPAEPPAQQVLQASDLLAAQQFVRIMPVGERLVSDILRLVREGRPETTNLSKIKNYVQWGPGPRAAQALMLASRARALIDGRLSPSLDDVIALAPSALRHRMSLTFAARAEGITMSDIIQTLLGRLG
jgi:MoxR-like ATPase